MSYRSCRRRFTVLNFISWAFSHIYCHFQQHLYCACAKWLFLNIRCKFRHRRSIHRSCFTSVKISAILRRFPLIFTFYILNVRHISTSDLFDIIFINLESIPQEYKRTSILHFDNSHQVWSWYDHPLPSYSVFICWYVTWPCDFDLWTFDLEQLQYMAGHVTNLATKFEDLLPIRSWVMSYNVSRWLPMKMRTRRLRMRRITWPVSRGLKTISYFNPRPRFAYSLCNFAGSTMKVIKVICENIALPHVKTYEFLRMREIMLSVKDALNVLLQSFLSTSVYPIGL